jgi:plastocyanin
VTAHAPADIPAAGTTQSTTATPAAGSQTGTIPSVTGTGTTTTTPTPPPSIPRVQVTAVEYSFTLSRTTVPAGKVIFEFVNHGMDEHNLNMGQAEEPLAGSFPNTVSGGIVDQTVQLRPGKYTLFCSLPEHASKGMKATLVAE